MDAAPFVIEETTVDSGGSANRLHMLFDFLLNAQIMLALARQDPEPVTDALRDTPGRCCPGSNG